MYILKLTTAILAAGLVHTVHAQTLIWEDDFNGTKIDSNSWTYDVGATGWGNQELQKYTDDEENSFIEDGNLVIQALRDGDSFTSARLKTHGRMDYTYGTIEARIKLPNLADGLWPAFWQLGSNFGQVGWPQCGELDIMETGMASAIASGTVNSELSSAFHWYHESEDYTGQADHDGTVNISGNFYDDYHIFGMTWTPELVTYWVDDESNVIASLGIEGEATSEFRQNNFLILNLAVGGNFPGLLTADAITAAFPAKMYVDYIRIYDNGDTAVTLASESAKAGKFGIYTEANNTSETLALGVDAELFLWNNLTPTTGTAVEGDDALIYDVAASDWLGFGFSGNYDLNMSNYSDGHINFQIKTTLTTQLNIGVASSAAGEGWVALVDGDEQYGLVRDGEWHAVSIPLNLFTNVDFNTIKQSFMLSGDAPSEAGQLAIDDIYWSESVDLPAPTGSFGIYTETTVVDSSFELGTDGSLYVWSDTLTETAQNPAEGNSSLSYTSSGTNGWFGFGIAPSTKYDLSAFDNTEAALHFSLKSSSTTDFFIGMKSGAVDEIGQKWIAFNNGSDPYDFTRDGQWHNIVIPMTDFTQEVDLSAVSQLFELLGTNGDISDIEIDNIYLTGGSTDTPTDDETDGETEEPEIPDSDPSASASSELRSASNAIDGNTNTRWESAHGVDPSWLVYDLGTTTSLSNVTIYWETANAMDYLIQASNDNSTWTTLASETGLASGERVDSVAVSGEYRYLRIYGTARNTIWGYSIWEIVVN